MSEAFVDWCGRPVWDGLAEEQALRDARADDAEHARDEAEGDQGDDRRQA